MGRHVEESFADLIGLKWLLKKIIGGWRDFGGCTIENGRGYGLGRVYGVVYDLKVLGNYLRH